MTNDKVFNQINEQIRDHLIAQRAVSAKYIDGVPRCLYRTRDGMKCAVGALIKDEFYDPILEDEDAEAPVVVRAVAQSLGLTELDPTTIHLMWRWQQYHDADYQAWIEGKPWATSPEEVYKDMKVMYRESHPAKD